MHLSPDDGPARHFARVAMVVVTALLAGAGRGSAQDADPVLGSFSFTSEGQPIEITSDRLDFAYKERQTVFRGDVEVVQGDVHLDCDVLTVHFREVEGQQKLENVVADGNVKIRQGARTATGERATFDEKARTLELTGNAVLEEGSNRASGDVIVVYPDESRMEIRGDNSRVKLLLFPKETPGATPSPSPGAGETGAAAPGTAIPAVESTPKSDGSAQGAPG